MPLFFMVFLLLNTACIRKEIIKPEAPPAVPPVESKYIERFLDGNDLEQWEMFQNPPQKDDAEAIL